MNGDEFPLTFVEHREGTEESGKEHTAIWKDDAGNEYYLPEDEEFEELSSLANVVAEEL